MVIIADSARVDKMASQVVSDNLEVVHISSYIRGYHAYMDVWAPVQDEMLILRREPTNISDRNAVAVFKKIKWWVMFLST